MTCNDCICEVDCIRCGVAEVFVSSVPPKYVCQRCLEKEQEKYEQEIESGEITNV